MERWIVGLVVGALVVAGASTTFGDVDNVGFERLPGDATKDGKVNLSDLSVLGSNWEQSGPSISWDRGDFTADNTVNLSDLSVLGSNWGYGETTGSTDGSTAASAGSTVPEPATLIIWSLLGALGIGVGWWRRRKAA